MTPGVATRRIVEHVRPLPVVTVSVEDAVGMVTAEDITSPIDIPPWDNSAMDGYAARARDLDGSTAMRLTVVAEVAAGTFPTRRIGRGECARVFTGAPIPLGADCVIRQEDVTSLGGGSIQIDQTRDVGRNVRPQGEDLRTGDCAIKRGTTIGAAQIGVATSIGMPDIRVFRRPVVAIMASGDEIVDLDQREAVLAGTKIASSNSYTLKALTRDAGAEPLYLGIVKDDPAALKACLTNAAPADVIVTTAGVSVGEHDHLHAVMRDLGLMDNFWRVRMRPGAPVAFGRLGSLGGVPWIGLPGNPVSTMVTFELFVRPALRRMLGHERPFRRTVTVRVADEITLSPNLRHFLRVVLDDAGDERWARLTGPQGSGLLTSMEKADALLVVPEDMPVVPAGATLHALVLNDPVFVTDVQW